VGYGSSTRGKDKMSGDKMSREAKDKK